MIINENLIAENLESKMGLLIQTLDGINRRAAKRTQGKFQTTPALMKMIKDSGADDSEQFIRFLNQFDPTGNQAKYTQWILKAGSEGRFRLPEDGERVQTTLSIFDTIKKSGRVQINKDINSYKNFREFETLMQQYKGEGEDLGQSVNQWIKWIKTQGYELIYRDDLYTLLRFEKTGEKITVFPASIGKFESRHIDVKFKTDKDKGENITVDKAAVAVSHLACGTSYCVASPQTAEAYLRAPLFAFFKKGKFSFLADEEFNEFANTKDQMIQTSSVQLAFFLTKVVLKAGDKINRLYPLQNRIRDVLENKPVPEKVKKYMEQALRVGDTESHS